MVHKDEDQALKVTSAGLRVFERNDKKVGLPKVHRSSHILPDLTWTPSMSIVLLWMRSHFAGTGRLSVCLSHVTRRPTCPIALCDQTNSAPNSGRALAHAEGAYSLPSCTPKPHKATGQEFHMKKSGTRSLTHAYFEAILLRSCKERFPKSTSSGAYMA